MRTSRTLLIGAVTLLAFGVGGCGTQISPRGGYPEIMEEAADRRAEYRVRCSDCIVNYRVAGQLETTHVEGSWNRVLSVARGDLLSLTAESRGHGFAEVVIWLGGREVARDRISGGGGVRTASAHHGVP